MEGLTEEQFKELMALSDLAAILVSLKPELVQTYEESDNPIETNKPEPTQ